MKSTQKLNLKIFVWSINFARIARRCLYILTDHIQIRHLALHWIGVNLAHVPSHVRLLDVAYLQYPLAFLGVRDHHAMVLRDDVRLYGENRLGIHTQPSNLCSSARLEGVGDASSDGGDVESKRDTLAK